jgi:hypothetical protein
MAAAAVEVSEAITADLDIYAPILQQTCLKNEYNREYSPLASIQPGAPIEFIVKGAENLYLDLNNTRLTVQAKITKANGTNIDAASAGPVNLALHSLWREMTYELNGRPVSEPNQLYPYRALIETVLNYSEEVQKTRLVAEGWLKDTAGKMSDTDVAGENAGLKERTKWFAGSALVEFSGRPHLDLFQQGRVLLPGVDMHLKCVPSSNEFFIKCKAPAQNAAQEQYKVVIEKAILTIRTKELIGDAALGHTAILEQGKSAMIPHQRVQVKHLSIPQNTTSYTFENVYTDNLPDLVVIGLVADADFSGSYTKNPFNFQAFGVTRMELKRNGMSVPRQGYTPKFADKLFTKDYLTFQEQLGYDVDDKCVSLTPTEWANGYTFFTFKITDGPIGSGTDGPRSKAAHGSIRLDITLSAAQTFPIKVIIYSAALGVLKIDKFKNVIVE